MAEVRLPGPILRNEKEDMLDRKADASDQYISLSIECVVGGSSCTQSWEV